MISTLIPALTRIFGKVPVVKHYNLSWNTAGISDGVLLATLRASTVRPQLVEMFAEVVTAFNAGSGNILTVGSDAASGDQYIGASAITEGTPGFYPASNANVKFRIVANSPIYVKYAGGSGVAQVETAVVVEDTPGTLTAGNATLTVTTAIAGFVGSPLDIVVALATNDTQDQVATKFRAALAANAQVAAHFTVGGATNAVILTARVVAANDTTLNIAYADTTSAGLVDDASSNNTTAGVAPATAGNANIYLRVTPLFQGT